MRTVVLVGPPGAGKTTIGRRLARALDIPLTDTDDIISEIEGAPCGEVFSRMGEEKFRELEARVVAAAVPAGGVVSLGGGAVVTESTRRLLKDYPVVWVDVSVATGVQRTSGNDARPILQAEDPVARYRDLVETRRPLYAEVASMRIRTDRRRPQECVADILGYLDF